MPSWSWWVIWIALGVGAIGYFAFIALDLLAKAKRLFAKVEVVVVGAKPLIDAFSEKPDLPIFEGDLLSDVAPMAVNLAQGLRKREARRLQRQRRLINRLIEFKAEESEFLP